MALDNAQVSSLVDNLQRLYGFGIALAFREALRKFCFKETESSPATGAKDNTEINWHAWPEAVSFMVTAGVFFHGMNRFFEKMYVQPGMNGLLGNTLGQMLLMFDFGIFFLEALIISVAAFRLTDSKYRFYDALLVLFAVDAGWAIWWVLLQSTGVVNLPVPITYKFMWLDLGVVAAYTIVFAFYRRKQIERRSYNYVFAAITLLRTVSDYCINWNDFYFG